MGPIRYCLIGVAIGALAANAAVIPGMYQTFNKPIRGAEISILNTHICRYNTGVREVKRNPLDTTAYHVTCNDGAQYPYIYFTLKDDSDDTSTTPNTASK